VQSHAIFRITRHIETYLAVSNYRKRSPFSSNGLPELENLAKTGQKCYTYNEPKVDNLEAKWRVDVKYVFTPNAWKLRGKFFREPWNVIEPFPIGKLPCASE
jgi:hypothetical protein